MKINFNTVKHHLKKWWNKGGNRLIGFDDDGDRIYSLGRGEQICLIAGCTAGTLLLLYIIF